MERPSRKLDNAYLGPYTIEKFIGNSANKLRFAPTMKVYPVFHSWKLKLYADNACKRQPQTTNPEPIFVKDNEEYVVKENLDQRKRRNRIQYLVKWEDGIRLM